MKWSIRIMVTLIIAALVIIGGRALYKQFTAPVAEQFREPSVRIISPEPMSATDLVLKAIGELVATSTREYIANRQFNDIFFENISLNEDAGAIRGEFVINIKEENDEGASVGGMEGESELENHLFEGQ